MAKRDDDTYLVKLRQRALFPSKAAHMTVGQRLTVLGISGYRRRLENELKRDCFEPWEAAAFLDSEERWATVILGELIRGKR